MVVEFGLPSSDRAPSSVCTSFRMLLFLPKLQDHAAADLYKHVLLHVNQHACRKKGPNKYLCYVVEIIIVVLFEIQANS